MFERSESRLPAKGPLNRAMTYSSCRDGLFSCIKDNTFVKGPYVSLCFIPMQQPLQQGMEG